MTTLETRGRKPGQPKVGGAVKGSIQVHTNAVREAVLRVFEEVNENDDYLNALALDDKKLFLSLLARLIPSEVAVDHKVSHKFDMGQMMSAAQSHLDNQAAPLAPPSEPVVINAQPEPVTPARPQTELLVERPLPVATGERETYEGYE
jgi:hypothetical protein